MAMDYPHLFPGYGPSIWPVIHRSQTFESGYLELFNGPESAFALKLVIKTLYMPNRTKFIHSVSL